MRGALVQTASLWPAPRRAETTRLSTDAVGERATRKRRGASIEHRGPIDLPAVSRRDPPRQSQAAFPLRQRHRPEKGASSPAVERLRVDKRGARWVVRRRAARWIERVEAAASTLSGRDGGPQDKNEARRALESRGSGPDDQVGHAQASPWDHRTRARCRLHQTRRGILCRTLRSRADGNTSRRIEAIAGVGFPEILEMGGRPFPRRRPRPATCGRDDAGPARSRRSHPAAVPPKGLSLAPGLEGSRAREADVSAGGPGPACRSRNGQACPGRSGTEQENRHGPTGTDTRQRAIELRRDRRRRAVLSDFGAWPWISTRRLSSRRSGVRVARHRTHCPKPSTTSRERGIRFPLG